ncbi:MAG: TolC family protein [Polyangiaceae bacterium]
MLSMRGVVRAWSAGAMGIVLAVLAVREARAEEAVCAGKVTRENVAGCAVRASLAVRAQSEAVEAAKGRRTAAEVVLPSAPVVSVSGAARTAAGVGPAVNVYAELSQEIEIGGQREARQRAAEAGVVAEEKRAAATGRDAGLSGLRAYFEVIAAIEEVRLAKRVEAAWGRVETAVLAAEESGGAAGIEAELASANALRAMQHRLAAERAEKAARTALAGLLGRDASAGPLVVEGELLPVTGAEAAARKAAGSSGVEPLEVGVLLSEKRAAEAKVEALSRARVPNLTVSVLVQRDGFDETVVGLGVSLPIPLPHPATRTNAGEIAEASALARKAGAEAEGARRKVQTELATAAAEMLARKAEVDGVSAEKLARTEKSFANVTAEMEAGRLSPKEAAGLQQALVEVLEAHLAARRALCLASVEVARAAGLAVEGGAR